MQFKNNLFNLAEQSVDLLQAVIDGLLRLCRVTFPGHRRLIGPMAGHRFSGALGKAIDGRANLR